MFRSVVSFSLNYVNKKEFLKRIPFAEKNGCLVINNHSVNI